VSQLGELKGDSHTNEFFKFEAVALVQIVLLEGSLDLVVSGARNAQPDELRLDFLNVQAASLVSIGLSEVVEAEANESEQSDQLVERVSALLFAVNHTADQVESLLVEIVGQSLQDITQSANGSSGGTLGSSVELVASSSEQIVQPQVAKEIDGALAEEVKNGGQITRQFSIESETVLLKDFTEVANLDGAFAFLIERSENLFDLCHLSLTLRGNLEN
jgi:hypothetical protein